RRRRGPRDPGEAAGRRFALDLGGDQNARTRPPRPPRALGSPGTKRRIFGHFGQCASRRRRTSRGGESGAYVRRRRHAARARSGAASLGGARRGHTRTHHRCHERREKSMIEAVMIWNEPNNKSHWDPEIDPGWKRFSAMAIAAGQAIRAENS